MERNLKTKEFKKAVIGTVIAGFVLTMCLCCFVITAFSWFVPEKKAGVGGVQPLVESYEVDSVLTVTLNENIIDKDIGNEPLLPGDNIVFIIEIKDIAPNILCIHVDLSDLTWDTVDIPRQGGGNYTMLDMYTVSIFDDVLDDFGAPMRISENVVSDKMRIATVTRASSAPFENIIFRVTFAPPPEIGMDTVNKLQQKIFYFGSITLLEG